MHRLSFVVLLTAVGCANQQAAEREESDRLSSNNRSMPSAGDETQRPPPDDEDLAEKPKKSSGASGNAAAAAVAAQEAARKLEQARVDSAKQCAALENRPVPTAEEDDMGLELALADASSAPGGLYADGVDKASLRALFEQRLATLPPGDESAVTQYVQKLGAALAGPKARVTFVVVEDAQSRIGSYPGGWVVLSTGLLAQLGTEADVAAMLAHEIAHVAARDPLNEYARARFSACSIGVTGANLVMAGASDVPGGPGAVQGMGLNKTMQVFAADDIAAALKAPGTDGSYVLFLLRQNMGMQRMLRPLEAELKADEATFTMMANGGYDAGQLSKVVSLENTNRSSERTAALAKKQRRGRTPPLPAALKWPKP